MFKKIKSLKFKYEVNENGIVRNVKSKKILKQRINQRGYYTIGYNDSERGHSIPKEVHRLVAETFLKDFDKFPVVNHIDGNKLNNNVTNLEMCTYSDNSKHAYNTGLTPKPPISQAKRIILKNITKNITFSTYKEAYKWLLENTSYKPKYKTFVGEIRRQCKGLKNITYDCKWSY